uniref:Uncharacterized protein n=1 Tax=Heterorhabditis bacteriophora TaxID=37862 RepID=A0A1I7WH73_HETBA
MRKASDPPEGTVANELTAIQKTPRVAAGMRKRNWLCIDKGAGNSEGRYERCIEDKLRMECGEDSRLRMRREEEEDGWEIETAQLSFFTDTVIPTQPMTDDGKLLLMFTFKKLSTVLTIACLVDSENSSSCLMIPLIDVRLILRSEAILFIDLLLSQKILFMATFLMRVFSDLLFHS